MSELANMREAANALARRVEDLQKEKKPTRGDFVRAVLSVWDETVRNFPELEHERDVAVVWLTKTWTLEELEQPLS